MRVYPDACVVIYMVERHVELLPRIHAIWQTTRPTFVVSALTRLECRVRPLRQLNEILLHRYERFFQVAANEWASISDAVFDRAATLRARHRLKTPDALHLAAAIEAGCDEFWTNDHRLDTAASGYLRVLALS
jgi:predicted nucleic acid-binding protein